MFSRILTRRTAGVIGLVGAGIGGGVTLRLSDSPQVFADDALHAPKYKWPHSGMFSTFDHARFFFN